MGLLKELPLDESCEDIFEQIVSTLAKSFEAPIALIEIRGEGQDARHSQCGLSEIEGGSLPSWQTTHICVEATMGHGLIVSDTAQDPRFREHPALLDKGIRFFAGVPILGLHDEPIGSLCVFDTRPRQITEQQNATLKDLAQSASNAIELLQGKLQQLPQFIGSESQRAVATSPTKGDVHHSP